MSAQLSHVDWLGHPMAEPILQFNLLPSLSLDASQAASLLPPLMLVCYEDAQIANSADSLPPALLHRHLSRWLLHSQQLTPILDTSDQALPLAALPRPEFENLLLHCGVSLLAGELRKTIAREEVSFLRQTLGDSAVNFSYLGDAPQVTRTAIDLAHLPEQIRYLGVGLLAHVFKRCSASVGKRGLLRLPVLCDGQCPDNDFHSLQLALSALNFINPKWLSFFPSTH